MPISVHWLDKRRVSIHVIYEGAWTWDEFQEAGREVAFFMKAVDHPVVVILDTNQVLNLPPGNIISNAVSLIAKFPENLLLLIVVVNTAIIGAFLPVIANQSKRSHLLRSASSLEKAFNMAEKAISNR